MSLASVKNRCPYIYTACTYTFISHLMNAIYNMSEKEKVVHRKAYQIIIMCYIHEAACMAACMATCMAACMAL